MKHISYILQDEYEHLLEQRRKLQQEYRIQSQRKRESCEQWAETRHDNADYEEAERQQNLISTRISSLQSVIDNTKIILYDTLQNTEKRAIIGSTISLDIDWKICQYVLGGNPTLPGRISYQSPLGQAILTKTEWDKIIFTHDKLKKHISILSVN